MQPTDVKYELFYSADDTSWVCVTENWPSYSWLADTPQEALAGFIEHLLPEMVAT